MEKKEAFAKRLQTRKMYNEFDATDEKWWVRVVATIARYNKKMRPRHWLSCCGALTALFGVYALFCVLFGYANVLDETTLRASSFYGELASHTGAYVWLGGQKDAAIGAHVFAARRNFSLAVSRRLALVASSFDDSRLVAQAFDCTDLFSASADVRARLLDPMESAETLLADAPALGCTCAPMFATNARLLSFSVPSNGAASDHNETVVHALDVRDELEHVYDLLDAAALAAADVKLAVTNESQNERYNEPRGSFALIRRARLRLHFSDRYCHIQTVWLSNEMAVCAQRCLDLMRGIDVRERARMQWRLGIRLNEAVFGAPPPPSSPNDAAAAQKARPQSKDEL